MPEMLRRYEARLRGGSSSLMRDPLVWRERRGQAELVLAACAGSLLQEGEPSSPASPELAMPPTRGLDPLEVARGWSELFEVVADRLAEILAGNPHEARLQRTVLATLNRCVLALVQRMSGQLNTMITDRFHEAQMGDRRQMAREIHDWLGTGVSLALRRLDVYESQAQPGGVAGAELESIRKALYDVSDSARQLASGLRQRLPETTVDRALRSFAHQVAPASTTVTITVCGDESTLPYHHRDELFVVLREGLRNAFAHAGAGHVLVRLDIKPDEAVATVEDDGAGFAPGARAEGSGLRSMRERVELLDGMFLVNSPPGGGTIVHVWIPLPAPGRAHGR